MKTLKFALAAAFIAVLASCQKDSYDYGKDIREASEALRRQYQDKLYGTWQNIETLGGERQALVTNLDLRPDKQYDYSLVETTIDENGNPIDTAHADTVNSMNGTWSFGARRLDENGAPEPVLALEQRYGNNAANEWVIRFVSVDATTLKLDIFGVTVFKKQSNQP